MITKKYSSEEGDPAYVIFITDGDCSDKEASEVTIKSASDKGIFWQFVGIGHANFNFLENPSKTVDGFIAHEVQEVVPEAVTGEKDAVGPDGRPKYQGIDQSKIVPLLTAALQEAISKIEQLETRIQTLENK